MNNPFMNLEKGIMEDEKFVMGWCDNCEDTTQLNIQLMNESKSNKPYTELVCDKCYCISATIEQHIGIKYL